MIRVFLVDDQPAVRAGLRMRLALEPDLLVVGEAGNGCEALAKATDLAPDVVVMDIRLPCLDGIAATAALRTRSPRPAVVVLTLDDDPAAREAAQRAGAVAFVAKHEADGSLLAAIRHATRA